ncbi:MAG: hypothetical protein ACRENA_01960 [Vulcanimicrobiaceae bacterium]
MIARALAAALGLRVTERRAGGVAPYRCVIAELHERSKTIVLYRDALELLGRLVDSGRLPFDRAQLDEIAIAHECFHARAPQGSEESAHAFAASLLGLTESPAVLNDALARHLAGVA